MKYAKAHNGEPGSEGADERAGVEAEKDTADNIDLNIPEQFNVLGEKLNKMTQGLRYKGIMERSVGKLAPRPRTVAQLDIARYGAQEISRGRLPAVDVIWK